MALLCAALATGAADAQTATPSAPAAAPTEPDDPALQERAVEAGFMKTLFDVEAPKSRSRACFTRLYDAAHLKAHPYQHIVEIRISAHYDPIERKQKDSDFPRAKWGYAIHSRLRGGKLKTFLDEGTCSFAIPGKSNHGSTGFEILCNAACDSGDLFNIEPDGKSAKLSVKEDLVHPEFVEPGAPEKLAAKADDALFRLYRAKDSLCDFDKP
jgi:hypothetical protein